MSSSKAAKLRQTEVGDAPVDVFAPLNAALPGGIVSGEVVLVAPDGQISIDYPQNPLGPLPARTVVEHLYVGAKVLLAFDGGDRTLPIVLGIVQDRIRPEGRTIHLKANRIVLDAHEELLLRCGEGSFAVRRDGKVNVKGKDVLSRATRTNKVRGATVLIN